MTDFPARPRVLFLIDYYLPGHKAGGPIRTAVSMVHYLGTRFAFHVVTRDHDLGDSAPYPDVEPGRWVELDLASCRYLTRHERTLRGIRRVVLDAPHDVLYVNSIFSVPLSIKPLLLRRLRLIPRRRLVIAPRGELHSSAVALKQWKKRIFLRLARAIGLYTDATWQASSRYEQEDIQRTFGSGQRVVIAPDLRIGTQGRTPGSPVRHSPRLRVAFVSRISPMKNLDGALRILAGVRGEVEFDIYGPREDRRYWERCEALMQRLPSNVTARYSRLLAHSEVDAVLSGYDLLLLPSLGENFGHVIIESLAAGCPVLISDRTPWRDLASHGVGWDLPLEDADAFRDVIEACCAASQSDRASRAERARAFATTQEPRAEDLERTASLFQSVD